MAPTDVLIRGAGPIGCAAALALRARGLSVALVGEAPPRRESRPLALSDSSRLILERLGVWGALEATPIRTIRVSQAGAFGRTTLDADDAGVPALGYVIEYGALSEALRRAAGELPAGEGLEARCTVHAEGWAGDAREKRYAQDALVARVRTRPGAAGTAFERFTPHGPLALLPLAGDYALIWSTQPHEAAALAAMPEAGFLARLEGVAGPACGKPTGVAQRSVVPLAMRVRAARVGERAVYIGNAAQTLHPVAGQGLNLGLRDAWELAESLRDAADPGDARVLARYAASRRFDAGATIRVTDSLAGVFLGAGRLPRAARGLALTALDVLPGPRRFFTRRMIFGAAAFP
ncbi:MAG: FAD-dependent monooxygenase [Betaproteobacteria bacterium]